jgi:hypothetical protein
MNFKIDELAGRALDAAIAERVMGLVPCKSPHHVEGALMYAPGPCHAQPDSPDKGDDTSLYSTDATAADEVLQRMRVRGYGWTIGTHKRGWYVRCFELPDAGLLFRHWVAVNELLTTAVCHAALGAR